MSWRKTFFGGVIGISFINAWVVWEEMKKDKESNIRELPKEIMSEEKQQRRLRMFLKRYIKEEAKDNQK